MKLKKIIITIFFIGFFLSILIALFIKYNNKTEFIDSNSTLWKNYTIQNTKIDGKMYKLIVADTPQRKEKGLMFIRKPVDFDGMIFNYDKAEIRSFWNKNTLIDLEILWMNKGVVIGNTQLPSIEKSKKIVVVKSPEIADSVVELIQ